MVIKKFTIARYIHDAVSDAIERSPLFFFIKSPPTFSNLPLFVIFKLRPIKKKLMGTKFEPVKVEDHLPRIVEVSRFQCFINC